MFVFSLPHLAETQPPKVSDESCDEDSSCSLSPGLWTNPGPLLGLQPQPTLQQVLAGVYTDFHKYIINMSKIEANTIMLVLTSQQCINQVPPPSGPAPCANVTSGMVAQSIQPAESGRILDSVLSQKQVGKESN